MSYERDEKKWPGSAQVCDESRRGLDQKNRQYGTGVTAGGESRRWDLYWSARSPRPGRTGRGCEGERASRVARKKEQRSRGLGAQPPPPPPPPPRSCGTGPSETRQRDARDRGPQVDVKDMRVVRESEAVVSLTLYKRLSRTHRGNKKQKKLKIK